MLVTNDPPRIVDGSFGSAKSVTGKMSIILSKDSLTGSGILSSTGGVDKFAGTRIDNECYGTVTTSDNVTYPFHARLLPMDLVYRDVWNWFSQDPASKPFKKGRAAMSHSVAHVYPRLVVDGRPVIIDGVEFWTKVGPK
jgi:hypothetical protein